MSSAVSIAKNSWPSAANYAALFAGEPYGIIAIHDDIEILAPDFVRKLRNYLNVYDIVGVMGTTCLTDAKWLAASLVVKNRQEVLGACTPEALHEASRRLV